NSVTGTPRRARCTCIECLSTPSNSFTLSRSQRDVSSATEQGFICRRIEWPSAFPGLAVHPATLAPSKPDRLHDRLELSLPHERSGNRLDTFHREGEVRPSAPERRAHPAPRCTRQG